MPEVDYCRWCADEAFDPRSCTCPHDCGIAGCTAGPGAIAEWTRRAVGNE